MADTRPLRTLVAYGDCNTLGFRTCEGNAYPEQVAAKLGLQVKNLGHTMSTTRELLTYARDYPPSNYDVALVQYGLVDSWLTFRHSPYVLYYPDSRGRRLLRRLTKKIKKFARRLNLQQWLGAVTVVPIEEYVDNIRRTALSAPATRFVLVGTAPNLDEPRNPRILAFNRALQALASELPNACYVDTFSLIEPRKDSLFFPDGTHLNAEAQAIVANAVQAALA